MNGITVTMPMSQYDHMREQAAKRDVYNFLHKEYTDVEKNEFKVVVDQFAVEKYFGKIVQNYSDNVSELLMENRQMRLLIKDISGMAKANYNSGSNSMSHTLERIINKTNEIVTKTQPIAEE